MLAEVRPQRCHLAAEHAIEQAATFLLLPRLPAQQWRIQVAPTVFLRTYRALAEQAVEQGADGFLVPVGGLQQRGDDVFGGLRCPVATAPPSPGFQRR